MAAPVNNTPSLHMATFDKDGESYTATVTLADGTVYPRSDVFSHSDKWLFIGLPYEPHDDQQKLWLNMRHVAVIEVEEI